MAGDARRSTAASFFMDEEEPEAPNVPTYDRVVELLNQASLMQKDALKVTTLKIVKELIVMKEPGLLDNFLDEMLAFQTDRSQDVRKFIVSFIEDAIKRDPEVLSKTVGNINLMLEDESVAVVKKVVLSMCSIFNNTLRWMYSSKASNEVKKQMWSFMQTLKNKITEMLDSENDGIRTHAIRFLEWVVLTLSPRTADSEIPKNMQKIFSTDQIRGDDQLLKRKKLDEDCNAAFSAILNYQGSQHISSVNLQTCMTSLTSIAKQRPQFMAQVVQGNETLHVNLPPTLAKSQVSSVRKSLKTTMLQLLKHPSSQPYNHQITTLLTDLGATQSEVAKAMPKIDKRKRKPVMDDMDSPSVKKTKLIPMEGPSVSDLAGKDDDDDDFLSLPVAPSKSKPPAAVSKSTSKPSALDETAEDLIPRLTPQNVADLVLLSMVMLPDNMPAQFQSTYTPIAAAGTDSQIQHLARLLATQLVSAGLVEDKTDSSTDKDKSKDGAASDSDEEEMGMTRHNIQTLVGGATDEPPPMEDPGDAMPTATAAPARKGVKLFKLSGVTTALDHNVLMKQSLNAFKRILHVEKFVQHGSAPRARIKIITGLVAQFGSLLKTELEEHILEDVRNRADLALAWLYQEYANFQGFNVSAAVEGKPSMDISSYDQCLTRLLTGILHIPDQKEGLFSRIILEAPCVTPGAIAVLRQYCTDDNRIYFGMTTLKELITLRPCMKLEFLDVLLDFTSHEKPVVRNNAILVTKKLHERTDLKGPIERYALYHLKLLLQPSPPDDLFGEEKGRPRNELNKWTYNEWSEDIIKLCLHLYLGLLPVNQKLVHELAQVYTQTNADIKRTILRVLETPVRGMGMRSPELLTLVEQCPKGAETLVTRIIHILTDKTPPSPELVDRVRDLYHKRVSDVRFLIPVLTGLTKQEVVDALPQLIKLNPVVVKEVFNRLLQAPAGGEMLSSPVTPADLLVALHTVDPNDCEMKIIIKASNMCFAEKAVYTQEVLALVIQELMELPTLPTLLMRTVIQSLAMYPKLIGFVMNIMQRLINKQVWTNKKVWEGFIKCCQRTKPHCFQVLLLLPAPQLKSCFETAPDLREPLYKHIQGFTPHQRAHIPKAIMSVLEKKSSSEDKKQDDDEKHKKKKITIDLSVDKEKAADKIKPEPQNPETGKDEVENMDTSQAEVKKEPSSPPQERVTRSSRKR